MLHPLLDIPALPGEVSDAPCDGWRVKPWDTVGLILDEGTGTRSGWLEFSRINNLSGASMHRLASASNCRGDANAGNGLRP